MLKLKWRYYRLFGIPRHIIRMKGFPLYRRYERLGYKGEWESHPTKGDRTIKDVERTYRDWENFSVEEISEEEAKEITLFIRLGGYHKRK